MWIFLDNRNLYIFQGIFLPKQVQNSKHVMWGNRWEGKFSQLICFLLFLKWNEPWQLFYTAVYIRLSRENGDKEESESVGNQRKLLTEYVSKTENLIVYDVYVEM